MAYVEVDGLKTYYEERGEGQPLLLLHGGFGNAPSMGGSAEALAEKYHVYLPERRGHGHTADPGEITYELMSDRFSLETSMKRGPVGRVLRPGRSWSSII